LNYPRKKGNSLIQKLIFKIQKYQDSLKILGTFGQGGHQGGARDMMKQNIGGIGEQAGKTWQDYIPAADGFNGMVNKPTMFLAGEAGAEHVNISPHGNKSSGGTPVVNINIAKIDRNADFEQLKPMIQRWILEANSRRGMI
jgi:hypothetical protein